MPDAPPLVPDQVSYFWDNPSTWQQLINSASQKSRALRMGAIAVKEIVSPPFFHSQTHTFPIFPSVFHPPKFHPPAFFPPAPPTLKGNAECNYFL